MRLGVDFGTTRVVVAAADRGNYPVVTFEDEEGVGREWYPAMVAARDSELRTGFRAQALTTDLDWTPCRSLKRLLTTAGPMDTILDRPACEVVTCFLADLREALLTSSNLKARLDDPLETAIAVPANATAGQRLLTVDAFRRAGFSVVRVLDEPSAAGLEYAWRRPRDAQVSRRHVAVYDLGGGTFDASVIAMEDALHEVLTTEGVQRLGGDDFDEVLLELALEQAGVAATPTGLERERLLEVCRLEKERFGPHTRRLSIELPPKGEPVTVTVADYEAALRPLVGESLDALAVALDRVARRLGREIERSTVVYQVGGASQLPTVGRTLREHYGRRVWRSPYPHASVAIGLAIAAEADLSPRIAGRLTRHFGVWREGAGGRLATFDTVFAKDSMLPAPGQPPLEAVRRYRGAHNVAHYRFAECSRLGDDGAPAGDVSSWREFRFPLLPSLLSQRLEATEVVRLTEEGDEIEERYRCTSDSVVEVAIANLTAGYERSVTFDGVAPTPPSPDGASG